MNDINARTRALTNLEGDGVTHVQFNPEDDRTPHVPIRDFIAAFARQSG